MPCPMTDGDENVNGLPWEEVFDDPKLRIGLFTKNLSGCSCSQTVNGAGTTLALIVSYGKCFFSPNLVKVEKRRCARTWRFDRVFVSETGATEWAGCVSVEAQCSLLNSMVRGSDVRKTAVLLRFLLQGHCVKCHLHFSPKDIIQDRFYNLMKDL